MVKFNLQFSCVVFGGIRIVLIFIAAYFFYVFYAAVAADWAEARKQFGTIVLLGTILQIVLACVFFLVETARFIFKLRRGVGVRNMLLYDLITIAVLIIGATLPFLYDKYFG